MLTIAPPLPACAELPLHLRQLVFHGIEDAHQVDVDDAARFVRRHVRQPDETLRDAGIVDGDIEPAEALDGQRNEVLRKPLFRDIAGQRGTLDRQRCRHLLERRGIDVGKHQPRALGGQSHAKPPAETAGRAGDQNRQSVEAHGSAFLVDQLDGERGQQPHHVAIESAPFRDWRHCRQARAGRRPGRSRRTGRTRRRGRTSSRRGGRCRAARNSARHSRARTAGRAPRGRCRQGRAGRGTRIHAAAAIACTGRRGRRRDGRASTIPSRARRSRSAHPWRRSCCPAGSRHAPAKPGRRRRACFR